VSAPSVPQTRRSAGRPGTEDAVRSARALLDRGERVDVQAVARDLGVSRATVHRWFGTRDDLMRAVFAGLAREFIVQARAQVTGDGDERLFSFLRQIADISAAYAPMRAAAAREPGITLRVILDPDGPVQAQLVAAVTDLLAPSRSPATLAGLRTDIDTLVSASVALHWATIAGGREPDSRRYEDIARALFARQAGA